MMPNFLKYSFLLIFICFSTNLFAQIDREEEIDIDEFILELFPVQEEDDGIENYDDIYEALYQFYRNPLNLNQATRQDLQQLFSLSELQINSFLNYREKNGKLLTIYELQAVPYFDIISIRKILPFVSIRETAISKDTRSVWQRIIEENDNHYVIMRYNQILQEKRGYTPADTNSSGELNSRYLGSPDQTYLRYRVSHPKDFSLGFTLEKDAGEQYLFNPSQNYYGVDFLSFHAYFENQGRFKKIAVGDYQIGVGQNLLLTAGFTVGKGAETITTVRRSTIGIRPYTSVLESGFFRGVAATYELNNNFELTGFYSRLRRDASLVSQVNVVIDSANIDEGGQATIINETEFLTENFVESIRASGLRRSQNEFDARQTFTEQVIGGHLLFTGLEGNLQLGGTFMHIGYDLNLQRRDRIYNRFDFNGDENYNAGLHFSYNWQNFNFFGEGAISKSGGKGGVAGFVSSLSPKVDFAMLLRHYDRDFHTFYGAAFGEGSRNINESGIYWGIKIRPFKKWELSAYYDKFSFPDIRFGADAPSQGSEHLLRLTYKPKRHISLFFQYRSESKELNQRENTTNFDFLANRLSNNFIFNINYKAEKYISLKTRVQVNTLSQGDFHSEGFMIFQDIGLDFRKFKFDARFAIFDDNTRRNFEDSYGSTFLYVYEKNVLWAPTMVRYSGRGVRYMLLARYKINRNWDIWLRLAHTKRLDQNTIGSGLETIDGNELTQITAQVRFKL